MIDERPKGGGWRRLLWEVLILLLLAAAGYGYWLWQDHQHRSQLEQQAAEHAAERAEVEQELRQRLDAASSAEGAGVTRAFAIGIAALAEERRWPEVDAAVVEILALPGVRFIHVLGMDGQVYVSSDRKLTATGNAGDEAAWALAADGLVQRADPSAGHQYAMPVGGDAVLWLGYGSGGEGASADGG